MRGFVFGTRRVKRFRSLANRQIYFLNELKQYSVYKTEKGKAHTGRSSIAGQELPTNEKEGAIVFNLNCKHSFLSLRQGASCLMRLEQLPNPFMVQITLFETGYAKE